MLEIKIINLFDNQTITFLVNESYHLFCQLRGYHNLSKEMETKLKNKLKNLYIASNDNNSKIYVAYKSKQIVGCAYIMNNSYLSDLFVKKEYQNRGIGSLLLKKIIMNIEKNEQIVLNTRSDLIEFYKKYGFSTVEQKDKLVTMKR